MNRQDIDELTEVFVEESQEIVENLNKEVLELEQYVNDPATLDRELINNIFRYVHTLKGNSGLAGADKLRDLAHKMESLLDRLRKDKITLTGEMVDLFFEGIDLFKVILQEIITGKDHGANIADLIYKLEIILAGGDLQTAPPPPEVQPAKGKPPTVPSAKPVAPVSAEKGASLIPDDIKRILTEYEESRLLENLQKRLTVYELILNLMMEGFDRIVTHAIDKMNTVGEVIAKVPSSKTLPNYELQVRIIFASPKSTEALTNLIKTVDELAPEDFSINPLITPDQEITQLEELIRPPKQPPPSPKPSPAPRPPKKPTPAPRPPEKPTPAVVQKTAPPKTVVPPPPQIQAPPVARARPVTETAPEKPERESIDTGGNTVKVDIKKLDSLMNIVGELVLAKARYVQLESELDRVADQKGLLEHFKRTNKLTSKKLEDLREGILQVRMVQVGTLFSRFPRLVRDLAKTNNKQIRLLLEGKETELDKAVIDKMGRPLTHLIRNAADHGIEAPKTRREKGKTEMGTITLRASQEGSYIVIEIEDDGAGIDVDRIREKAIENGLIEKGIKLSESEILNFIFHPGFSTAKKVTDTSGRGVGMDVVKLDITQLKGIIDTQTVLGRGTKFIIKLPLTLAIIQVLLIKASTHTYAIPLSSVTESFKLESKKIEIVDGQEVTQLRNVVLPLLRLNHAFDLPDNGHEGHTADSHRYVVVIELAEKKIGLVVDNLLGQQEIVIKPLGRYLLNTPGFAGATTLGNGRVVLILDIVTLIESLNQNKLNRKKPQEKQPVSAQKGQLLNVG